MISSTPKIVYTDEPMGEVEVMAIMSHSWS
jgi:hypothetical protein